MTRTRVLHDPGTGGMFSDIEVQDFAAMMADHEETVQVSSQ